jgi:hypothetical protein
MAITREQLVRLAKLGAKKRLLKLEEERRAIEALIGQSSGAARSRQRLEDRVLQLLVLAPGRITPTFPSTVILVPNASDSFCNR